MSGAEFATISGLNFHISTGNNLTANTQRVSRIIQLSEIMIIIDLWSSLSSRKFEHFIAYRYWSYKLNYIIDFVSLGVCFTRWCSLWHNFLFFENRWLEVGYQNEKIWQLYAEKMIMWNKITACDVTVVHWTYFRHRIEIYVQIFK